MHKLLWCCLLVFSTQAMAGKIGGKQFPENVEVGGQKLVMNGGGLRKKLVIKVYAGALYLKEKQTDAAAIIAADEPMLVRLHFIYGGVKAKQLTDAWNDGFMASLGADVVAMQSKIDAFNALFDSKPKSDDTYEIAYHPGKGVEVLFNGTSKGFVEGLDFKKAVFAIWLGDNIPGSLKKLKQGMLAG